MIISGVVLIAIVVAWRHMAAAASREKKQSDEWLPTHDTLSLVLRNKSVHREFMTANVPEM